MRHPKPLAPPRLLAALALSGLLCGATAALAGVPQRKRPPQKPATKKTEPQQPKQPTPTPTPAPEGRPQAKEFPSSMLIRWQGRPGVNRYRLQLATDEKFEDIVYDQAVEGRQHTVEGLPPGNYYWRVAAAAAETATFSKPAPVAIGEKPGAVATTSIVLPADAGGWRTATGEVVRLAPARLRPGGVVDFVGVGADGRVFAVDGASGISLWTARFRPEERRGDPALDMPTMFAPLAVESGRDEALVVVAMEGGVRALRGDTGREVWRARLEGRAAAGAAADVSGDAARELVVVTSDPARFYVLDGATGRALAGQKLDAAAVGAPSPVAAGGTRGAALALADGSVEIRSGDGSVLKSEKMPGGVTTTAPLAVMRGEMSFLVVGTERGLTALSLPDLKALGTIVAEDDRVQGTLNSTDMDGDGTAEIVILTRRGRVALISTVDGNVKWYAEGVTDAASSTFADVNADGVMDVIVPGG